MVKQVKKEEEQETLPTGDPIIRSTAGRKSGSTTEKPLREDPELQIDQKMQEPREEDES